MTHWSFRAGAGLLLGSYLVQAAMIYFGPPPVKALGIAFAAFPGMDPFIFGLGAAAAADWGHGDFVVIREFGDDVTKPSMDASDAATMSVATKVVSAHSYLISRIVGGYCDPDDPLWSCFLEEAAFA